MSAKKQSPKHIKLTSHPTTTQEVVPITWGAKTAAERGPIIGTLTDAARRNAIGAHSGSYALYRALAVAAGLLLGKPLGIGAASWIAVRLGVAVLPAGVGWSAVVGGGLLAGIGFTMALFIAGLALDAGSLDAAKVGILAASAVSAVLGMLVLVRALPAPSEPPR